MSWSDGRTRSNADQWWCLCFRFATSRRCTRWQGYVWPMWQDATHGRSYPLPVPAFRIAEAAELLGVSDDTVRRWVDSGRLPVERDQSRRKVIDGAILA